MAKNCCALQQETQGNLSGAFAIFCANLIQQRIAESALHQQTGTNPPAGQYRNWIRR